MARWKIVGPDRFGTFSVVDTATGEVLMSGLSQVGAVIFLEQLTKKHTRPNPALTAAQWEQIPAERKAIVTEQRFVIDGGKWVPAVIVEAVEIDAKGRRTTRHRTTRGTSSDAWTGPRPGTKAGRKKVFASVPADMVEGVVTMTSDQWWAAPLGRKFTTARSETKTDESGNVYTRCTTVDRYLWNDDRTKLTRVVIAGPTVTTTTAEAPAGPKRGRRKAVAKANPQLLTIGNPASSKELAEALAAYRRFHGCDPKVTSKVPNGEGRVLIALGELRRIDYRPNRGDRRGPTWFHHFRPGVVLAATPDGKQLFIVDRKTGKRLVDWERGIVR